MSDDAPFAPPRSPTPVVIELDKVERLGSGCLWVIALAGQALAAASFARFAGWDGPGPFLALAFAIAFAITTLLTPFLMWRVARIRAADVRAPMEALVAASGADGWWPTWLHPVRTPHVSGRIDGIRWVARFPSGRNTLAKPVVRDRVAVFVEHPTPIALTVIPRDVVGTLDRLGSRTAVTGEPTLDEGYLVAAEDVDRLRTLLAVPAVRAALDAALALHPRFRLQTSLVGIWWWCPDPIEPAAIVAARDALLDLAKALDAAR